MKQQLSKRRQPLVRTAIYAFMTATVVIIVTLLTFIVLGYQFNKRDGKIEQGGLLQFASVPQGAAVTLDGIKLGSQTNTKSTVDVGSHSVNFDLKGYRTWKKTIGITAGQVGWVSYARLVPTTVTPKEVRTFSELTGALASPQHNYMLLHQSGDQPTFTLANIQGDTVRYTDLTLPAGSYTAPAEGKTQSFTLDSWSHDEQAVLIKHMYDDGKTEWILLNRGDPTKSINISTTFGVEPSKLIFAGNGNRLLFVQTDDIVRRINLDEQTLSRPLASKVDTFTAYDDKTITYTTTANDKSQRTVGYAAIDIPQPITIATYPADGTVLNAAMATYFSQRYVVILHGDKLTIQTGTLPTVGGAAKLKTVATQTVPAGASNLDMSTNSRFAVMQLPDGFATYDIDLMKFDKSTWATQSPAPKQITWLDDYIIWSDNGNQLRFYDFDGGNQQNIMPVTEGFAASVSPNDKYLYGIYKTDKGFEFRRVQMTP
jgi:hypothetical protein